MADLGALPPHIRGEIIEGVLYTQPHLRPRPRSRHQHVLSLIDHDLIGRYDRSHDVPGGWWILPEPGTEPEGSPKWSSMPVQKRCQSPRCARSRARGMQDSGHLATGRAS